MKKIYIIFFFCFFSKSVFSDTSFIFSNNLKESYLGNYLYILEDKTNQLSFADIQKSTNFKKSTTNVPKLGSTASTIWIKLIVKNHYNIEHLILDLTAPLIDKVDFFSPSSEGNEYTITKLGQYKPFNERKYKHPSYLFDIYIPYGTSKIYYLKISSNDPIEVPIKIITPTELFKSLTQQNFFFGLYIGLMIIMILYNLFVYFTVRDKSYLYYVFYILSVTLTQATFQGYTFKFIWPNIPQLETQSIMLCSIFVGFASVEFLRVFLNTKTLIPKFDKVFLVAYLLYAISIIVVLTGFYRESWALITTIVTPLSIYMLFVGIKLARQGSRTATFFTLAWSIFLIGVFIHAFKDFGILPYNYFTKYTMPVGSAIETVLLSFALADKINIYRKETEESQKKALEALKENERIIKEQNIILEKKVEERTHELSESNLSLNTALKDLKQAQAKLVDAEKMASLGQLTAGIAHEINNPINFVSSNITPLRRDVDDIIQIINKYEEIINLSNEREKFSEVEKLRKELDYDYLVNELNTLLKGMADGANRTIEIVRGLKNFSKLDESDLKLANINEGIESTLTILQSTFRDKVKVNLELSEIPEIECYAGKLNQVFMNIINNAVQAVAEVHKETKTGEVTIKTYQKENKVIISIKDNGVGMSEEVKQHIFEPFFTTKKVGEGTGLGLSIVFSIIELHKGELTVESEPGKGTEFIISLPITQSQT